VKERQWQLGFFVSAIIISLFVTGTARAHDQWLEVESFWTKGEVASAKIYFRMGEDFAHGEEFRVHRRDKYQQFNLYRGDVSAAPAGQPILLQEDSGPIGTVRLTATGGTHMVSLESTIRTLEIPAKNFQEYLLEKRLIDMLAYRADHGQEDAPSVEHYSRHLKAIFQVGDGVIGNSHPFVTRPIGQELEIVPDINPYALPEAGGALGVQVFFSGKPLANRAITLSNLAGNTMTLTTLRTDKDGKAAFWIEKKRGRWMIHLVHMQHSDSEAPPVYRSWWASLTFSFAD